MSNTPLKRCTGPCGQEYLATAEHWHRQKNGLYGFTSQCKKCKNAYGKEHYSIPEVKENAKKREKEYRSRQEVKERRQEYKREYNSRPEVREHMREYHKKYGRSLHVKCYRSRPEVMEHRRAYEKQYEKLPKVREQRKSYEREYLSRKEVKERRRVHKHNRRARIRSIGGVHTHEQIQDRLRRQRHKCYYAACGYSKLKKEKGKYIYHIEHVVPLSKGGSNDISNIVLSCPRCNLSKHDKLLHEWLEGGRLL